jgi:glycosyl transferase family 25
MNTYVINLERSKDRKKSIIEECKNVNICPIIVEAIDGKKLTKDDLKNTTKFCEIFGSNSLKGCALSHLKVWKKFLKDPYPIALILEDDCKFESDVFINELNQGLSELPNDFDILFLDCVHSNYMTYLMELSKIKYPTNAKKYSNSLYKPDFTLQTHSYIISKNGVKKIIDYFEKMLIYTHVDAQLNDITPPLNKFVLKNKITYQDVSIEKSLNITTKYPNKFNKVFKYVKMDSNMSLDYLLSINVIEIPVPLIEERYPINMWVIIFIICGMCFTDAKSLCLFLLWFNITEIEFTNKRLIDIIGMSLSVIIGFYLRVGTFCPHTPPNLR